MKIRAILLLAACLIRGVGMHAQKVAVKTNLVADALLNAHAGVEMSLSPQWTVELAGEFNGWTLSHQRKWKHWAVQPEVRRWLCDRMAGHFVGAHLHGGQFNMGGFDTGMKLLGTDWSKLADHRYQGWFTGAGLAYGYAWILGHHWNMEAEIGAGYSFVRYDRFRCANCGKKVGSNQTHHYVGLTRAQLNLVYVF